MEYYNNFNDDEELREKANQYEYLLTRIREAISNYFNTFESRTKMVVVEMSTETFDILSNGSLIKNASECDKIFGLKIKKVEDNRCWFRLKEKEDE